MFIAPKLFASSLLFLIGLFKNTSVDNINYKCTYELQKISPLIEAVLRNIRKEFFKLFAKFLYPGNFFQESFQL